MDFVSLFSRFSKRNYVLMAKNLFVLMVSGLLAGCVTYDEDVKCYESALFVSVNFLTTTKNDSVVFELENHTLAKTVAESFICKDSNKSDYLITDTILSLEKYKCSGDYPLLYAYHIFLEKPIDKVDFNFIKLKLVAYNLGVKTEIDISDFIHGGEVTNIITEKDTAYWFEQKVNPIRPYFSDYESPAQSNRLGCLEVFCVASVPIMESEFCYEE